MLTGIKGIIVGCLMASVGMVGSVFDRIPATIDPTDYLFVVEISTQTNYLFHHKVLIDQFPVSTGSKTRYKGDREMTEGLWRLGARVDRDLTPIYGARLIYLEKYDPKTKEFVKTNRAFHGTNEPHNIGTPTSMGCVYHLDDDIIHIYSTVPHHTLVLTVKEME